MQNELIIFCAILILCLGLYLFLSRLKKQFDKRLNSLETQLQSCEFVLSELQSGHQKFQATCQDKESQLQNWQLEHQQVSKQLEHRIKVLQQQLSTYQEQLEQIQQQQPEDKLYSRAQKMVQLGADVDEIVRECDLPLAEAEILISMHKSKSR